jgi:hypothetical protein
MREFRNTPRTSSKKHGAAFIGGQEIECSVRDLSASGARLIFRQPTFLPKTFRLRFDSEDQRVTVIWQRGLQAGVHFQAPIRAPAAARPRRLLTWG